ncbi:MAG: single-stranded-DNA-specific exonuclease RecJ [Clostridia bacterium]|nr:single-stranded-DNA-specific exonuclease RecJ [Clostridia bacterium]
MLRKWNIRQQNSQDVESLRKALGCSHFFARILINRGYITTDDASAFLKADSSVLGDPYLFKAMDYTAARIEKAILQKERITVYGDYDVDGITATSLMVKAIRELGGVVDYYIPNRFDEGYGVNSSAVEKIAKRGTKLIITVDTGITAVDEVEYAKNLGIEVIITDHHECQAELPKTTIVNPKQPDSGYPFPHLAGVGVVYKIACALDARYGKGDGARRYAPLAAIGTVADIMPLIGENRYIVRSGLADLRNTGCKGLDKMIERCLGEKPIDTAAISFMIAPRINAAGRLGNAETGVELLITEDEARAEQIVEQLCRENNRRQEIENRILTDAIALMEKDPLADKRSAIVLWQKDWHNGVVGIVASRLKDRYMKPCFLFSLNEEFAKGSGRSMQPFNLFDALTNISDTCEKFGGHTLAAGVLVKRNRLREFRDALCKEVDRFLESNTFDCSIDIDCELQDGDLNLNNIKALDALAPFGRKNSLPIFCMRKVRLLGATPTANGNHMRLTLQCGHLRTTAFYFNVAPKDFCYQPGDLIDIVFEAEINTYNGRQSVQLSLKDVRSSRCGEKSVREQMGRLSAGAVYSEDVPSRDDAVALYLYLKRQVEKERLKLDFYTLPEYIEKEQRYNLSYTKTHYSLEILRELGVIEYESDGVYISELKIYPEVRVSLRDSEILRNISKKAGEHAWS